MMTPRENVLSLFRRMGCETMPTDFSMCPSLKAAFCEKTHCPPAEIGQRYGSPFGYVQDLSIEPQDEARFMRYYAERGLKPGTHIDAWGVAHEPGSEASMHMTRMVNPLRDAQSVEELMEYPYPVLIPDSGRQRTQVEAIHAKGLAAMGSMQCTIWETAWYMRSMEGLMMDMMDDEDMASAILDKVTENACTRASSFARAGCDLIFLGDDIGMQRTPMMSMELYRQWLKPRLAQVIRAARAEKPDVIILYHSCGYVLPFIDDLIEVGVDVLNPVQPECMDFQEVFERFGGRISFLGAIGTQTTMPFGTPEQVRQRVEEVLTIAGDKGGLLAAPTHLLEPEVPVENVLAYIDACRRFKG